MRRRFRDIYPWMGAMPFVSEGLVLLAVYELSEPVLNDPDGDA